MDPSTGLQAEAFHTINHTVLDQISAAIMDTLAKMRTIKTAKTSIATTIETEVTSRMHGMTRTIIDSKTGMKISKIKTGSTTEENQQNINTAGTNPEHK